MASRRIAVSITAAVVAAIGLVAATATAAHADEQTNPTFVSWSPWPQTGQAAAGGYFVLDDGHPLQHLVPSPYPFSLCDPGQTARKSIASLRTRIATIGAVTASCENHGASASAASSLASVSLFNGAILVKGIETRCEAADNTLTVGATWGSLVTKSNYARNGSGALVIPNVATVAFNVHQVDEVGGYAWAIMVDVLPVKLGTVTLVPEMLIGIGACAISRPDPF